MSTASLDVLKKSRFSSGSDKQEKLEELYNQKIKVKVITLDKLLELYGTPDLIKIDVEGHEYEVLEGLNRKAKKLHLNGQKKIMKDLIKVLNIFMIWATISLV